jgi:ligand-binding sensor domain-containing protein
VGELIIDSYGQKWIRVRAEHSLIVFNDNGTITDKTDDQVKVVTSAQGNGNIPGNKVFSLAEDNDGEIWIGTDEGVAVFYSPENVFSNYNFDAQRILIPRNDGSGLADILLEFETITAIAVDGANNKWIGTDRSGVFHLSPDGQIEYNHFTVQNSPLFSNNITSIVISQDGEVFIGTANGIISYKSSASEGGPTYSDVYAYPNPVESGYNGPIAIKGLVTNADFKITDINGTLIFRGRAEGGQAIWNGTNFNGRRAQSGVYLVFVSNEDGSETLVTKILFIN